MMRRIAVLDAPTNLGLRPPTATSVPGCAKAPGRAARPRPAGPAAGPGRRLPHPAPVRPRRLAARRRRVPRPGDRRLLGGPGRPDRRDHRPAGSSRWCSAGTARCCSAPRWPCAGSARTVGGRIGLVFVDGHSDFRHPGNASYVGAAAGEDLALVTGRGQADLAAIEGRRPYFRDIDVVVLGIRATGRVPARPPGRRVHHPAGAGAARRGRRTDRPVGPRAARRLRRLLGAHRRRRARPGGDAGGRRARPGRHRLRRAGDAARRPGRHPALPRHGADRLRPGLRPRRLVRRRDRQHRRVRAGTGLRAGRDAATAAAGHPVAAVPEAGQRAAGRPCQHPYPSSVEPVVPGRPDECRTDGRGRLLRPPDRPRAAPTGWRCPRPTASPEPEASRQRAPDRSGGPRPHDAGARSAPGLAR